MSNIAEPIVTEEALSLTALPGKLEASIDRLIRIKDEAYSGLSEEVSEVIETLKTIQQGCVSVLDGFEYPAGLSIRQVLALAMEAGEVSILSFLLMPYHPDPSERRLYNAWEIYGGPDPDTDLVLYSDENRVMAWFGALQYAEWRAQKLEEIKELTTSLEENPGLDAQYALDAAQRELDESIAEELFPAR